MNETDTRSAAIARVRAEDDRCCVTCGQKGGSCKWMDDPIVCMRQQLIDLRAITEARPEASANGRRFILVQSTIGLQVYERLGKDRNDNSYIGAFPTIDRALEIVAALGGVVVEDDHE
jgi:hypothetical protein